MDIQFSPRERALHRGKRPLLTEPNGKADRSGVKFRFTAAHRPDHALSAVMTGFAADTQPKMPPCALIMARPAA